MKEKEKKKNQQGYQLSHVLLMCCAVLSHSAESNSLQSHGLQPTRLLCLWGFSRQEYWSGLPCLLQVLLLRTPLYLKLVEVKVSQSCPTLCNPMDYTAQGILQARILEWVAFSPPRAFVSMFASVDKSGGNQPPGQSPVILISQHSCPCVLNEGWSVWLQKMAEVKICDFSWLQRLGLKRG